eukprot:TRINITY_DN3259_c0_g1_i1.p1 TRINITY_DN3259_c0_g1~~TRINITY_DN3259_c0_g1_i1.p1  ORF type:complete len:278 (-),score=16.95 TRINITY_DN3259_c0_g1_i1:407-1240(-)
MKAFSGCLLLILFLHCGAEIDPSCPTPQTIVFGQAYTYKTGTPDCPQYLLDLGANYRSNDVVFNGPPSSDTIFNLVLPRDAYPTSYGSTFLWTQSRRFPACSFPEAKYYLYGKNAQTDVQFNMSITPAAAIKTLSEDTRSFGGQLRGAQVDTYSFPITRAEGVTMILSLTSSVGLGQVTASLNECPKSDYISNTTNYVWFYNKNQRPQNISLTTGNSPSTIYFVAYSLNSSLPMTYEAAISLFTGSMTASTNVDSTSNGHHLSVCIIPILFGLTRLL